MARHHITCGRARTLALVLALALGTVLSLAATARLDAAETSENSLVTDLSRHLISIESTFTGADLLMFGTIGAIPPDGGQADVVIVLRGPDTAQIVRRKEQVAGIWVNYGAQELTSVPGFYAVVSTRPLEEIAALAVLERYEIGVANLNPRPQVTASGAGADDAAPYVEATARIRSRQGLFVEAPGGIRFLGSSLFRAAIEMPANVPDGRYTARVYLFRDGQIVEAQTSTLFVTKAGFERVIYEFAHQRPLAYGIVAVIVASFAGWAASVIFRRA